MTAWWGWPVASILASFGLMLFIGAWSMWEEGNPTWPMPVLFGIACVFPLIAACVVSLS